MIDGEDLMDYDELLEGCESEIETHLLRSLYPELYPDAQKEIQAQYMIDYYDMPVTLPDFAFPDAKIAIYVVLMILVESLFPTLFYHLTTGF